MALAGIDMALWDALARVHDVRFPASGRGGEAGSAYGPVGYNGALKSAKAAEIWAHRGFLGVKNEDRLSVGQRRPENHSAIRAAIADVALMVDYNQCLTPTEAIERLHVLDGEGLAWIEEPTLAHDFHGHAECRAPFERPSNAAKTGGENSTSVTRSTPARRT